jgi:quercetin dioxygenase-like cupin family protein
MSAFCKNWGASMGKKFYVLTSACAGLVVAALALAPRVVIAEDAAPQPKIKLLMKNEPVSSVSGKEAYMIDVDWGVGSSTGRHIHSGDEYAEIVEGELQLNVDGQPPKTVKTGESYHNLAGVVHETKNVSGKPARSIALLVIDKGRPPSEPVK